MLLHGHASSQPPLVHHAANLRHLSRVRIDRERDVEIDIGFVERFDAIVSLEALKIAPGLEHMGVVRKGNRLSIQPVTRQEFDIVVRLGRGGRSARARR